MSNHLLRRQTGLSLIELMIAMVLGLVVVGGATGVVLSSKQAYRASEQLSRTQENARIAFELMAREIREAAGNPCGRSLPVANILNGASGASAEWWMRFHDGLRGSDGTGGNPDALELMSGAGSGVTVTSHDRTPGNAGSPANFKVNTTKHGIVDADIIMVCDYTQATILQVASASDSNVTVTFNKGGSTSPGNCTKGLGYPVVCTANGNQKPYGQNSTIVKLQATRWYIDENPNGRNALYRASMAKGVVSAGEEIAEGVEDMQLEYLVPGQDYLEASSVPNWSEVTAIRVTLTLKGGEAVGTDGSELTRTLSHVVTLRNRVS